jgi:hypothetical protein
MINKPLPITQYKRFVPYGTRPNFAFGKTSFMLKPLYAMPHKMAQEVL